MLKKLKYIIQTMTPFGTPCYSLCSAFMSANSFGIGISRSYLYTTLALVVCDDVLLSILVKYLWYVHFVYSKNL